MPEIDPANVGVSVSEGVVTLSGEVRNYSERVGVNEATLRVAGVSTVVDDLVTRSSAKMSHDDIEVAKRVRERLDELDPAVPSTVQVSVRQGIVTLSGEVEWNSQREAAERAIERITGLRAVHNELRLARHRGT